LRATHTPRKYCANKRANIAANIAANKRANIAQTIAQGKRKQSRKESANKNSFGTASVCERGPNALANGSG
jgi:hypothetical protein